MLAQPESFLLFSKGNRPFACSLGTRFFPSAPNAKHPSFLSSRRSPGVGTPVGSSLFTGKGTHYSLETTALERISQLLEHHHLKKWGFVIYRCTYGDDTAWAQFMRHMDERRDALLTRTYGVEDADDDSVKDLMERLDWRVQEDPATLDGASKDEVRRRFRQLVTTSLEPEESVEVTVSNRHENARWDFCVHVDKASMDSVLQDSAPTGKRRVRRYVNLIRADMSWNLPDYDRFDWSKHTPPDPDVEDDEHDDREEEIEGSRLFDVGWMKVEVDHLIPDVFDSFIHDHLWDSCYRRPPEFMGYI